MHTLTHAESIMYTLKVTQLPVEYIHFLYKAVVRIIALFRSEFGVRCRRSALSHGERDQCGLHTIESYLLRTTKNESEVNNVNRLESSAIAIAKFTRNAIPMFVSSYHLFAFQFDERFIGVDDIQMASLNIYSL